MKRHVSSFGRQVNLIMANEVTPHLTAEEYMDKGEYENELKQVIGDTKVIPASLASLPQEGKKYRG